MPLFHGNALMALWGPSVLMGATIATRPRFSASAFLDDVRRFGATKFSYVGKAIAYILATPERPDDADNTLKSAFGTEASVRDRDRFRARFGCYLIEGYGQSEGGAAINPVLGMPKGALGKPVNGVDLTVISPETGEECPPAQFDAEGRLLNAGAAIGELVNRSGRGSFEGYYRREDAEQERLRRGWYWTGDLGYVDADGFFYFAGRTGDWLRVDSENFAAGPVEAIISRHPDVAVAAVYPVPDTASGAGDQLMVALETVPGKAFDPDAFAAWLTRSPISARSGCRATSGSRPRSPRRPPGRSPRSGLRSEAWACDDDVWWRPLGRSDIRFARLTDDDRAAWPPGWPRTGDLPWAGMTSPYPVSRRRAWRRCRGLPSGRRPVVTRLEGRWAQPTPFLLAATRAPPSCRAGVVPARRAPTSRRRRRRRPCPRRAPRATCRRCRGAACATRRGPR